jgi:hypothetical protein
MILHKNPSGGSCTVACGQTDRIRLILTSLNCFANMPENGMIIIVHTGQVLEIFVLGGIE